MNVRLIETWKESVKSNDLGRIAEIVAADAVLFSPVMFKPIQGHTMIGGYLAAANRVLNGPDFHYLDEWRSDNGAVMEFETTLEGTKINGVDIFRFDRARGLIVSIKVMIRPLSALQLINRVMGTEVPEPR